MKRNLSLAHILSSDESISKHIQEGIEEIKKDKKALTNQAEKYNAKFKDQIVEGTRQKQTLLAQNAGLSEQEVMKKHGRFIPTLHTPILNFLYYFMQENHDTEKEVIRGREDKKYAQLINEVVNSKHMDNPGEMDQFIYGNCTHKVFQTMKKLKRMALSEHNENEAAAAYIACMKLCRKFNLEYDKIPGR